MSIEKAKKATTEEQAVINQLESLSISEEGIAIAKKQLGLVKDLATKKENLKLIKEILAML